MKKLIGIGILLVGTSLFAERYSMFVEYNFLKGCNSNASEKQCICILSEIEKVVTEDEMIKYSINAASGKKNPPELSGKIMNAAMKCRGVK
ncbi:MAG: hypothetical protein DSY40_00470 [Nautilia sp.]|nr:MAG: hypothetical protein DSY40_00470 [Nautilia sp.]